MRKHRSILAILILGAFVLAAAVPALAQGATKKIVIEEKKTGKKLEIIVHDEGDEPLDVKDLEEAQQNLRSVQHKDSLEKELTNMPASFYKDINYRNDEELELILKNPPRPNPDNLKAGLEYSDFPHIFVRYAVRVKTSRPGTAVAKAPAKDGKRRSLSSRSGYVRRVIEMDIGPVILKYARLYEVDPYLVKAIIEVESNYQPSACSHAGARGLMQLMPGTARRLGVTDIYNPEQNIAGGTRYIKAMLDHFKDDKLAIAAYNAGPGSVQKYGGIPPYQETQRYVWKVLRAWGKK